MLPLAFDILSPSTMLFLALLAVLLYGERLPEVMRTWGKHFIELKKNVQGIRDQFEEVARGVTSTMDQPPQRQEPAAEREEATAPKFEPPQSEPVAERTEEGSGRLHSPADRR